MQSVIVTGTDTGIGKTLLSALIMAGEPEYFYWKPVQSGTVEGTDTETVLNLSEATPDRMLRSAYELKEPLSPHAAAALEGVTIARERLQLPEDYSPLLIEGAGGLLVPLNDDTLFIDMFAAWRLPVLLACRSTLGTINHTLLSLRMLQSAGIPVLGCIMIGPINSSNKHAIEHYGGAEVLAEIPWLSNEEMHDLTGVYSQHCKKLSNALRTT